MLQGTKAMIVQFPVKLAQAKMLAMGDSTVDCIFCIISRTFHWAVIPGSSSSTMICNPPQFQIAPSIPVLRPNSIYTLCISATFWVEPRLNVDHHSPALALASRAAAALAAASSTHTKSAKTPLPEKSNSPTSHQKTLNANWEFGPVNSYNLELKLPG